MNKTAIKNFSVWARQKLIDDIKYKAGMLGITENGILEKLPQSTADLQFFDIGTKNYAEISGEQIKQRDALVSVIRERTKSFNNFKQAYENVIEEVAYTWFNRLIAIRFMEANGYLPSGVRVLSSENAAKTEPDFVTTPFDTDLDFKPYEQDTVIRLKDENRLDELFRMLFIKQCNKLNDILPELFEKTGDYTELLLTISFTDKDGIVQHLVHDIDEDDFNVEKQGQVEIIGWLYQYYNIEPKQAVFDGLKKNIKISRDNIPAATQLFTPDWIVRYMVENSLGRVFINSELGAANEKLAEDERIEKEKQLASRFGWKYYIPEAEQTPEVAQKTRELIKQNAVKSVEEISVIDPCMGSAHILVYAFNVLMQMYVYKGYTERDAVRLILEKNLYGLDIDRRAYQLAYFALMMKARQYDRRFFTRKVSPQVYAPTGYEEGMEYGSLIKVDELPPMPQPKAAPTLFDKYQEELNAWNFKRLLNKKYNVVVTNPPYMGASGMNAKLSEFVKKNYPDSKSDMFAAFIERGFDMTKKNGFNCMVTMQSWMFLSSFETLRKKFLNAYTINNLMHMENMVLGIAFGTAVTNFRKAHIEGFEGDYIHVKLSDLEDDKPKVFPTKSKRNRTASAHNFAKIPGSPVAYWVGEGLLRAFEEGTPIREMSDARQGIIPGNTEAFLRNWYEVNIAKIGFNHKKSEDIVKYNKKWFPYNKGGAFRRWYGNIEHLINMENNGYDIINSGLNNNYRLRDPILYFKEAVTWSKISSGSFSTRIMPSGNLFDIAGCCIFNLNENIYYILGLCNSVIITQILNAISPTLNYEVDHIKNLPIVFNNEKHKDITSLVTANIALSRADWDAFETSWDFAHHPLVPKLTAVNSTTITPNSADTTNSALHSDGNSVLLKDLYNIWQQDCETRFNTLKQNEEELNRIFIDIYGLQDELTPQVDDKDVTVRKADLTRDVKSLISYAVGCMFGRYSPLKDGLMYAGGEWDLKKFQALIPGFEQKDATTEQTVTDHPVLPDPDNIIPICDDAYFDDDITAMFVNWIEAVYGKDTLEANLKFIAGALGGNGSPRQVIRKYFLGEFYKDHVKTYKKRPIYWLYDSGKQNGFKALFYMHRYNADTTGNMRVEYLHRLQRVYEKEINRMQEIIEGSEDNKEIINATKRKEKLQKQLKETKEYDARVAHLALSRIEIDLDDGVKVNHEKVQTATDGKNMGILAKI